MDTNRLCRSYSSGESNITLRQSCNPQEVRDTFQEIRSDMFGDFNTMMARANYTFYQFYLIFIQIHPHKRFLNSVGSQSESD